ncbi:MAG: hypothetical protein ABH844_07535 [Candidatus Omnitrophota bacterium]
MDRCFAVLNASDERITALAASWHNNSNGWKIEDFCYANAKGFEKGRVLDVALAADSICDVVDKLKTKSGKNIQQVYAGVSSSSIDVISSRGVIILSRYGGEVSKRGIARCMDIAATIKIPLNREILHKMTCAFFIDGEKVNNPMGLEATKLGIELNIFTIPSSVVNNMAKAISQAGFVPKGFVFSGIASAHRVLTEGDKEKGTVLLDMGRDMTEALFFSRGNLMGCKILPIGVNEIWQNQGKMDINNLKHLVSEVNTLSKGEKLNKVVIVGDDAEIENLVELLEVNFRCPVKIGSCLTRPLEELPVDRDGYIRNLGILDHLMEERKKEDLGGNIVSSVFKKILNFCDSYF